MKFKTFLPRPLTTDENEELQRRLATGQRPLWSFHHVEKDRICHEFAKGKKLWRIAKRHAATKDTIMCILKNGFSNGHENVRRHYKARRG